MIITNAMITKSIHIAHDQDGVTLLVALLLVGVLLGVSTSLLNITLKQYQLSGIALASEIAFQAANAGMECAMYHDFPKTGTGIFEVPGDGITEQTKTPEPICMGQGKGKVVGKSNSGYPSDGDGFSVSGEEQNFEFEFGTNSNLVCVNVSVYKYYSTSGDIPRKVNGVDLGNGDCMANTVCTIIQSRGYNVPCDSIKTSGRVVEREYTQIY